MGIWLLTAWLAAPSHAGCGDFPALVDEAQHAVLAALDVAAVNDALQRAEEALGCGQVATGEELARYWLAEAAMLVDSADAASAARSLAAAHRVAPGVWVSDYGPKLRAAYDGAVAAGVTEGRLSLDPAPRRYRAVLDGVVSDFPATVHAGLHAVQVGPRDGEVQFGRIVLVEEGQDMVVRTGLVEPEEPMVSVTEPAEVVEPAAPPPPVETRPERTRKKPAFLIMAGAAGAAAGGMAGAALSQDGAMRRATTVESADAAYQRQVIFGVSSYALAGVAVSGLALHFVL